MVKKTAWEEASDWFGRSIAAVVVMVAPGALGYWLDEKFGTQVLAPIGFLVGMILGTIGLVVLVQKKPPQALSKNRGTKVNESPGERLGETAASLFEENDSSK